MNKKVYPLISVIVPVYNSGMYLDVCLQSIQKQTYPHLEIILVDDGSTDDSSRICDSYASKDPRIRVLHQPNKGVRCARNAGLREAKGEYIGFVDSDDWLEPEMYTTLFETIRSFNADVAACSCFREEADHLESDCHIDRVTIYNSRKALHELYENKIVRNCMYAKLFKRQLYDELFYPEDTPCEDVEILCVLLFRAKRVVVHPATLYHCRVHAESMTHSEDEITRAYREFRSLDYQYRFLHDNGYLLKKQPRFVTKGVRLLERLSKQLDSPGNRSMYEDVMKRLRFYAQSPVRQLGLLNSLLLRFSLPQKPFKEAVR